MFKIHKNILNKKEQKNLLKFVKTKIKDLGENYPGLQSNPDLHSFKEVDIFLKKIKKFIKQYTISKCWANHTTGDYLFWHSHDNATYSLVYYLHNPTNLGLMFKKPFYNIEYTKGLNNSLVIFEGNKIHSVPCTPTKINRYTIAMELI